MDDFKAPVRVSSAEEVAEADSEDFAPISTMEEADTVPLSTKIVAAPSSRIPTSVKEQEPLREESPCICKQGELEKDPVQLRFAVAS